MALLSNMSIYPVQNDTLFLHRAFRMVLITWFTKTRVTPLASCYGFDSCPDIQGLKERCVMISWVRTTHLHGSSGQLLGCLGWGCQDHNIRDPTMVKGKILLILCADSSLVDLAFLFRWNGLVQRFLAMVLEHHLSNTF